MLTLLIATMAQGALAAASPPLSSFDPLCASPPVRTAGFPQGGAWKLGELPPGFAMLAVDKRVGDCAVNVLPRRDAGGEHVMTPANDPRRVLTPTGRSEPQRGLQRHRQR